jgi:tetratricopeptide (TPR) repeat protein
MGEHQRAITLCQRALELARVHHDMPLQVPTQDTLGRTYYTLGDYPGAIAVRIENIASLGPELERQRFGKAGFISVASRHYLSRCHAELGTFTEGNRYAEEAVRIAEAADHPHSLVAAYAGVGQLALHRGTLPRAVAVLERALAVCQEANIQVWFPIIATWLAFAYALTGRSTEAMELTESLEQTHSQRSTEEVLWHTRLSETYLLVGRIAEAQTLARRVLDLSHTQGEQGNQAWILRLLGNITLCRHPVDAGEAETHYHQALALANALGMRPLQAHCHFDLGSLQARSGRPEQARAEFAASAALYPRHGDDVLAAPGRGRAGAGGGSVMEL